MKSETTDMKLVPTQVLASQREVDRVTVRLVDSHCHSICQPQVGA